MSLTLTTPTARSTTLRPRSKSEIRLRKPRPRLALTCSKRPALQLCRTLPHSLEALDLSSASPTQTLASIRFIILSYLADIERRLSQVQSPNVHLEAWLTKKSELTIDDAAEWAVTALEMLEGIRADVCSHLPDVQFADLTSVETFIKSQLPDFPDLPGFNEMCARLPEMPHLPDMADMRSHFPDMPYLPDMNDVRSHLPDMPQLPDMEDMISDMRLKLDDVRTRFHDLDFERPLNFLPTLSTHLNNLHSHLSALELPTGLDLPTFPQSSMLSEFMDALLTSDLVADITNSAPDMVEEAEGLLEMAAQEVAEVAIAVKRSLEGYQLIKYHDLPHPWKNNPFVTHGYRFIPIERWPLLVMSLFKFHNETLNIHTHLIPCLLWGLNLIPLINSAHDFDLPELLFMCFALLCLFSSAVWHTMSGCAHHASMEFCARVDYVGIGWLISASVGTIVHYGFRCHPHIGHAYLCLCFVTGLAGNIFPFMKWFNMHEYRFYRIGFFLSLAFSAIGPLVSLSMMHSKGEMYQFMSPVIPSLISYLIGLAFYAAHFPERALPENIRRKLDCIGGGSHSIWHCFIVLAVSQHKTAIQSLKQGLQCFAEHEGGRA
ncbi:hemolysin-III related-domain-containing protein [Crucibulum laeve]|uniref:Hemolysin-III related-domain-containing protein n=1 Tax=Crucibulum laeve TaxID=68775 RepID=A0A5C3MHT1_9AGAR|nr:hemolysin-III related-domain-containing protein [Crucibulum laeve]